MAPAVTTRWVGTPTTVSGLDPLALDGLPTHLTPYARWVTPPPTGHTRVNPRLLLHRSANSPAVGVPGRWPGSIEWYPLSVAGQAVLDRLLSGLDGPSDLDRQWLRRLLATRILVNDDEIDVAVTPADLDRARDDFADTGQVRLERLVSSATVGALRTHYRRLIRDGEMPLGELQAARRWAARNEAIALRMHRWFAPVVASLVDREVRPSYALSFVYEAGGELPRHIQRPQGEYSLVVVFDASNESDHSAPALRLEGVNGALRVEQRLGDGVLYRGRTLLHSREALAPGTSLGLVYLHYVDVHFDGSLA
jgi:hypothetical protein